MNNKVPVGVGSIVIKNGKFLVGRRLGRNGQGTWSMPGGHLDFGETPEETAIRETLEETGMLAQNARFLCFTNDIFPEKDKHYLTLWMMVEWQSGEPALTETKEMSEFCWVDLNSLPSPLFLPLVNLLNSDSRNVLEEHLNSVQRTI